MTLTDDHRKRNLSAMTDHTEETTKTTEAVTWLGSQLLAHRRNVLNNLYSAIPEDRLDEASEALLDTLLLNLPYSMFATLVNELDEEFASKEEKAPEYRQVVQRWKEQKEEWRNTQWWPSPDYATVEEALVAARETFPRAEYRIASVPV